MKEKVIHSISPVFDERSHTLVLGSFPSVRSRQTAFFYGHPANRFWRVLSAVLRRDLPVSIEEKRDLLLSEGIALWDVIGSCEIEGSADSTIREVVPNDLSFLLSHAPIRRIFVNGKAAKHYYDRHQREILGVDAVCLPSTSAANASFSLEQLIEQWSVLLEK